MTGSYRIQLVSPAHFRRLAAEWGVYRGLDIPVRFGVQTAYVCEV